MERVMREAAKLLIAVCAVLTLTTQSVLPVYADITDHADTSAAPEEEGALALDYFDRIAVNSVRGSLTVRSGDEFSIAFPTGWEETPAYSVQDEILVVSGRKSTGSHEAAAEGSAVVLGEDEPGQGADPAKTPEREDTGVEAQAGETPQMVITVPAGTGLDTLRIAMEEGDLLISDITASSVTIQSGGGRLVMENDSLGTVDIYSDAGTAAVTGCSFGSLNIGMASGNVTVQSAEGLSRCRMEIKTDEGDITVNGTSQGPQYLQPGNGKKFLTIQIGDGNIDIIE